MGRQRGPQTVNFIFHVSGVVIPHWLATLGALPACKAIGARLAVEWVVSGVDTYKLVEEPWSEDGFEGWGEGGEMRAAVRTRPAEGE